MYVYAKALFIAFRIVQTTLERTPMKRLRLFLNRINSQQNDFALYSVAAAVSLLFLLIFSASTSPLYHSYIGSDSAFFCMVGQGMMRGLMPYRDFFDMKGPYLFFIEYLGQIICYGRAGIFFLQWLNLTISAVFAIKILRLFDLGSNIHRLLLFLAILPLAAVTFTSGNLTEEFSLVPLFSCLYLCLKYIEARQDGLEYTHPLWHGFWYGICFGYLALVRITNAALICAIVLAASICMITDKKIGNLLMNGVTFLLGCMLAVFPMFGFFLYQGLFDEMIYCVFHFGYAYSAEFSFGEHILQLWRVLPWLFILLTPAAIAFIIKDTGWRLRLVIALGTFATFLGVAVGNAYTHYFTLCLPLVLVGLALVSSRRRRYGRTSAVVPSNLLRLVYVVNAVYLAFSIFMLLPSTRTAANDDSAEYEQSVLAMAENIPKDERDSVFSYNIDVEWYYYTDDIFPCCKYCGWQNHYIELMPEIEDELAAMFDHTPPKWLVLPTDGEKPIPEAIGARIEKNYVVEFRNSDFTLLRYKHFTATDVSSLP